MMSRGTRTLTRDEAQTLAKRFSDTPRELHEALAKAQLSAEDIKRCMESRRFPADLLKELPGTRAFE